MIVKIGDKKNYKPLTTDGKTTVVMWDYNPILDNDGNETSNGKWVIEKINGKPDIETVKEMILSYYDKITESLIISGMKWKGMAVWLSSENQFNYKSIYDISVQTNGENLPISFKFGDIDKPQYYTFENLDDFREFYLGTIEHIQRTLRNGWKKKDNINWNAYEEKLK